MPEREKDQRWSLTGKLFITLNITAAIALIIVQGSTLIRPDRFWYLEIIALSYPFLLLINLFFVGVWAVRRHRYAFISAAVILIGYDKLISIYRPSLFSVDVMAPKSSVKLMSYNVRLFDLYNWSGNEKTRKKILDMLKSESPDILCFQEYYHQDSGTYENNKSLSKQLNLPHRSVIYGLTLYKNHHWGLATFSRYPIIDEGKLIFTKGSTNFGIYSDLVIQSDTIRVYNVHLQSNHFKEEDYKFLANPDSGDKAVILHGAKHLMKRIRRAVKKRSDQTDELALHIASSPYPVILCGDFNDPSFTYTYQVLNKLLDDAFVAKGKGFGITYDQFPIKLRLDYILYNRDRFLIHSYQTKHKKLSDHYPITTRFSILPVSETTP